MIVLDTNVVSELMRKSPDPAVEAWFAGRPVEDLFFSAVGEAELRYGAAIMPEGRRRNTLVADIDAVLRAAFENRILPFDRDEARMYAAIASMRRSAGRPVAPPDCQIAAIARTHGMAVATRNVRDFEDHGHRCDQSVGWRVNALPVKGQLAFERGARRELEATIARPGEGRVARRPGGVDAGQARPYDRRARQHRPRSPCRHRFPARSRPRPPPATAGA